MIPQHTHYDTLGVPHFSSQEVCKKAWRTKSFSQHPDLFKEEADKVVQTEIIKELNAAWYILGDHHRKKVYDDGLRKEYEAQPVETTPEKKKWRIRDIIFGIIAAIILLRFGLWLLKTILHFFLAQ